MTFEELREEGPHFMSPGVQRSLAVLHDGLAEHFAQLKQLALLQVSALLNLVEKETA